MPAARTAKVEDPGFAALVKSPAAAAEDSSPGDFQGCVGAHDITFEPDVTLTSGGATLPASATM